MSYPTSEQIIESIKHTNVNPYIPIVKSWKINFYNNKWNKETNEYKLRALEMLAMLIKTTEKSLTYTTTQGKEYKYQPQIKLITLGPSPSILSTLHEIGHAIWGNEEIDACRFSIAIFQQVFKKEFEKLEWSGHMLIRKQK